MKQGILIFVYILAVLTLSACAQKVIVSDCKTVEGGEQLFVCIKKLNP